MNKYVGFAITSSNKYWKRPRTDLWASDTDCTVLNVNWNYCSIIPNAGEDIVINLYGEPYHFNRNQGPSYITMMQDLIMGCPPPNTQWLQCFLLSITSRTSVFFDVSFNICCSALCFLFISLTTLSYSISCVFCCSRAFAWEVKPRIPCVQVPILSVCMCEYHLFFPADHLERWMRCVAAVLIGK
jgi:hypothetical protein